MSGRAGIHKRDKILGLRTDRAVKICELSDREGLGGLYFRRLLQEGKQLTPPLNPDILLSEIVNGSAVNGALTAAEILVANAGISNGDRTATDTVANITPGSDGVTPGSIAVYCTLNDTDSTVLTLRDLPIPIIGESGINSISGGLDGKLYDQFGREWGTVNYFTGVVVILDMPDPGLDGAADIKADYRLTDTFKAIGQLIAFSTPGSTILSPIPVDENVSIWGIVGDGVGTNGADILVRIEVLPTLDGNMLIVT